MGYRFISETYKITMMTFTVACLRAELMAGRTTSRALVEQVLERIGQPTYTSVFAEAALAEADASDKLRTLGIVRSQIEGLPVSVKDLYDISGQVTLAGSKVRESSPPAAVDAPVIARLRAAGAIIVGKTAMTEFAFGGVGTNPHYGTPKNPWRRDEGGGRVPGGSSSGAAVAVADRTCVMGLGTDTRGSVRIPAALCGVTGFKPTQSRIERTGAFPLSYTLDSVGPLANCIADCALFDSILAGASPPSEAKAPQPLPIEGLRLMVPKGCFVMEGLDEAVASSFERTVETLRAAGARIDSIDCPLFDRAHALYEGGGFAGPESFQIHRGSLETHRELYDPNVANRIALGAKASASDYVQLHIDRKQIISEARALVRPYDAMLLPTVACVAPTIAECDSSAETYAKYNLLFLRNTGLINMLDGCAATLPCHRPGTSPVGLMVAGNGGTDEHILAASMAIEGALGRA